MAGEIWILWTIRLSMFLYAIFLICMITRKQRSLQRWTWTVACFFFFLHFLAAFHFYHHWSHTHAFEDTAKQTLATIGLPFGAGIYFSYLFLLMWIADVCWWWLRKDAYEQRQFWVTAVIHGFIFFIAFNGTIVFEDGAIRWAAILTCLLLIGLVINRFMIRRADP